MSSSVGSNNIVSIQSPQLNTLLLHNQSAIFPYSPYGIVQSLPSYPSPVPRNTCRTEDASPFVLCFIQGNVSTCFGCKQKYLKPLVPPCHTIYALDMKSGAHSQCRIHHRVVMVTHITMSTCHVYKHSGHSGIHICLQYHKKSMLSYRKFTSKCFLLP